MGGMDAIIMNCFYFWILEFKPIQIHVDSGCVAYPDSYQFYGVQGFPTKDYYMCIVYCVLQPKEIVCLYIPPTSENLSNKGIGGSYSYRELLPSEIFDPVALHDASYGYVTCNM